MDPNETLRLLREWTRNALNDEYPSLVALEGAEHFEALDEWLSKGGFFPDDWSWTATTENGLQTPDEKLPEWDGEGMSVFPPPFNPQN